MIANIGWEFIQLPMSFGAKYE
ncbi:TPA: hypothetical protein GND40_000996 [Salmonella enterica subsp. indica]|uniref:Uncharacterized protein n=3 Tax=Salmonella enterica TaxID=28901 RepID=A0A5Y2QPS8_SALER|nr:hypothetical protein [Salmonella enterica subsp. indica serovar 11:b:e,n,x]EBP3213514.1 hypothetical protein [Salmonella enterica subsp. arizonae]ECF5885727.1 hypothetical protein [Salmonella enterica subsp. indica]ECI8273041.1 hypothetical protein [Salmonella enterica subsp. enterica]EDR2772024.1 hypothetical protein [Salmonella enterica subsp. enterica serovar Oslo]EEC4249051.1 hypothetical protein [Salmonella enterica subsp. diarizonae]EEM2500903.1 hypothetical protein [Salmonella enter